MIDVAEAIDVALTLLRTAVWVAAGIGLACTALVLLCVWAVTGGAKAARRALSAPLPASHSSGDSLAAAPAERRSQPHTPAWTRKEAA